MLQLLSSLWVTRAVGTFARVGLADVMEDGVEDYAAIAAGAGPLPRPGLRVLARAPGGGDGAGADTRALRAHAARAAAQFPFAQQHQDDGDLPQRLFRRHVDASR